MRAEFDQEFTFEVESAFTITGRGTAVIGKTLSGTVKAHERLELRRGNTRRLITCLGIEQPRIVPPRVGPFCLLVAATTASPLGPEDFRAGDVLTTIRSGRDPLGNDRDHFGETHTRWVAKAARTGDEWTADQCGICCYWVALSGKFGFDWGVCTNAASSRDATAMFEHDNCDHFDRANEWILPDDETRLS
jgi:Protein of unknown function (DUF3027)